jgi:Icc-related predicted phosphoesterase
VPRSRARATRVFYAADIHGSEPTFRKFLSSARFYEADVLVFGGDLMGKALVPIVRSNGVLRASFQGRDEEFEADGLADFVRAVEQPGFYWRVFDEDEYAAVESDPLAKHRCFHELASARLGAWLALAEERLAGTGVRMSLTGGNDDEPAVLETLDRHDGDHVSASEGRLVSLDDEHTMITVGLSTPTPWDTPREASEEEISAAIDASVALVPDLSRCVFNLHCPPKDTPIDTCLKLEVRPGELPRPIREGGRFLTTGGGSTAVREAISRYQPLVGLHGHIHESGGRFRIGRTQTFNPGSEYVQGVLQGVIVSLQDGRLASYQHTQG